MPNIQSILTSFIALALCYNVSGKDDKTTSPIVVTKGGEVTYNADERGNRVLDFSFCGYRQQTDSIPDLPAKIYVEWQEGDQSERLQNAIDYVSSLKPDKRTGMRGAVLVGEGTFMLSRPLRIAASGVVLRGASRHSTILKTTGVERGAVVYIEGKNDLCITDTLRVTSPYVPVNSRSLSLMGGKTLRPGTRLIIVRPSTKEWIAGIGCSVFGGSLPYWGWKAGEMDVRWMRNIASATADGTSDGIQKIEIDAPLTVALDTEQGGAYALTYEWKGRIHDSGVENLTIHSTALSSTDENHPWDGVYIDAAEDCWVRRTDFYGMAGSAVIVQRYAQQVTVEDCRSFAPASEIGGWRRRTFLTMGGKTLFQRCYSEQGINDFAAGFCAPGPNAFVQCEAEESHGMSGSVSSWATGLLFDNVNINGGSISFKNLGLDNWGGGWNTANSLMWQCAASRLDCYDVSADARCLAIGCWGYCQGDSRWYETNNHISQPRSIFHHQLAQRIGEAADRRCRLLMRNLDGSSSPSVERAAQMAAEALMPRITMKEWADTCCNTSCPPPCETAATLSRTLRPGRRAHETAAAQSQDTISVSGGRLMSGSKMLAGTFYRTPWWNGRTRYPYMDKAAYAVTRFVPGTEQRGGTDRIDTLKAVVERQNIAVWNQNYGLWYDRRRDDHERVSRTDGNVWPPFFEQAIARSGEGTAWDGLSLYDLSRLNTWYFHRINALAEAAPGMIMINQHFFQHNILEAGAHWVDAPWRSRNNIQSWGENKGKGTQFLEPVPFTGDKRIFTADLFYDTSNAGRADIYRQYIWNVLDATADARNIFHSVSEEYTGPAHFVEFWLRCIDEWQTLRHRKANVVLNATLDVTTAIMQQPSLAKLVDVVEIEQWYRHGGKLYAPEGGKNLAPRQHLRLTRTGNPDFRDIYTTVRDAVTAFPGKAVLYYAKAFDRHPWAVVMAGGSCPSLTLSDTRLAEALPLMRPAGEKDGVYTMEGDNATLIMNNSETAVPLPARAKAFAVNQKDGSLKPLKGDTIAPETLAIVFKKR